MAENNKTSIENLLDDQLQGLLLPAENPAFGWQIWLGICLIVLFLVYVLWRWKQFKNKPQNISQREIQLLQKSVEKNKNTQDIAIKLSSLLRQGLELNRLDEYRPEEISKWETFLLNLENACYSTSNSSRANLESLFEESQYWLNKI